MLASSHTKYFKAVFNDSCLLVVYNYLYKPMDSIS